MAEEASSRAVDLTTFMSFCRPLFLLMANAWIEADVPVGLSLGLCSKVLKFANLLQVVGKYFLDRCSSSLSIVRLDLQVLVILIFAMVLCCLVPFS